MHYPESQTEGLYLPLKPYRSGFDFKYHYQIRENSSFAIGLHSSVDTVNADLKDPDDIIGKIYALDQMDNEISLELSYKHIELNIAHRDLQGELSGYFLASQFGSFLSQLSGARYYQKLEADLSFTRFSLSANQQFRNYIEFELKNSIYVGAGSFYERHYVFQLFDPISDLSVQEISINRFVMNDTVLQLHVAAKSNLALSLKTTYLLPVYIDVEFQPSRGDEAAEVEATNLTLGASFELNLTYRF